MESKMVDVMIHIDLDIGHQNRENLRDLILNHEGVDAADDDVCHRPARGRQDLLLARR